ncbi:hypothetical protein D3C80_1183670 [compost metagenome]
MADQLGVEDRFNLVDVAVVDRQAGVAADDQLLDDRLDRLIEVDAVDIVARHQDVVDGDFVQRQQAFGQVQALVGVGFIGGVAVGIVVVVHGHGMALHAKRAQ